MNTNPIGWKRSYWPEPRPPASRLSRREAIANCREAVREREETAKAKRIAAALEED